MPPLLTLFSFVGLWLEPQGSFPSYEVKTNSILEIVVRSDKVVDFSSQLIIVLIVVRAGMTWLEGP